MRIFCSPFYDSVSQFQTQTHTQSFFSLWTGILYEALIFFFSFLSDEKESFSYKNAILRSYTHTRFENTAVRERGNEMTITEKPFECERKEEEKWKNLKEIGRKIFIGA